MSTRWRNKAKLEKLKPEPVRRARLRAPGGSRLRDADAHSPGFGAMRGRPSVTKTSPARSGKTQLSTRLARAAGYVNRIHLSKGLEGAGFPGPGQSGRAAGGPVRCPGAESAARRPLCRCQRPWRPETHFGAPAPPAGAASPAPPASARRRERERGPGTPHGWRPRPASPPPPGPPSWPRPPGAVLPTGAGPSPGAGPRQARPARRAPCVPAAGPRGAGGRAGGPRPALGRRGGYLAIAAAASRKPRGCRGCGNSPAWPRRPPPEGGAQRWEPPSPLSPSRCRRCCRLCVKADPETRIQVQKVDLEGERRHW
ncbi:unnamed protein product [Nyctereutes procyonoides]|uniref:(raccoon dog) hypothetical protein n=1 Tax=Nyctereutes procyonoides TaxID=34880 RepID=A0A811YVX4_NYCPR|nr:unnamed protein product [Nyctereutes procyonoides]